MDIHQLQVSYEPTQDRLLLQVRTRDAHLIAIWLTRRMVMRMWPHFRRMLTGMSVQAAAPGAMAVPEAQEMLAQAARAKALKTADFKTPFSSEPVQRPLGAEPMLPLTAKLRATPKGVLVLSLKDVQDRTMELRFGDTMAHGLNRLVEQALQRAEWGLSPAEPAAAAPPAAPSPATVLN